MNHQTSYTPIILIGAARSGTKLLRDVIGSHEAIAKIPFDINFVWKFDNEKISHDFLLPKNLTLAANKFINKYFEKFAGDKSFLIEKTVSNTLRIDFVKEVFPNAKFIYLTRDGRDVVESVARQWGTAPNNSYLLQKVKTFPLLKSLSYGIGYGMDLIKIKVLGQPSKSYVWGVKYPGYEKDLEEDSILEFCAKQWKACVENSEDRIKTIDSKNLLHIKYEDFVKNPIEQLTQIESFLGLKSPIDRSITKTINSSNIGKGFKKLSAEDQEKVLKIISPTLTQLKYAVK